jgi:hypothetical protein
MNAPRLAALAFALSLAAPAQAETIVFIRHGEKPEAGLGQLNCKGLNRALALPAFFAKAFPKIDKIFAPNPSVEKPDGGKDYDYVRPLATIEPTAIARSLPINAGFGFADTAGLEKALTAPELQDAIVVVAWEHKYIDVLARDLLAAHGGDPKAVPDWAYKDYDGVYVVTLTPSSASFERIAEGLDGQSEACPS